MKRFKWTEEFDKILIDNYGKISNNEIEILLNHEFKSNGVASRASELGLRIRFKWTKELDEILFKYYPIGDWNSIYKFIPNVTKEMVYNRVSNLENVSSDCFWNESDILLLRETYPHYTNKYLSRNIFKNRKPDDIRTLANNLGLKKSLEKGIQWYNREEMLNDLINLSLKLNRTPLYSELYSNGLPSDKSYERYFGGYREACKICGLDINFVSFGNKEKIKSKNNDWCLSLGEVVITNFLIDNKIDYIKEIQYSEVLNISEFGTKRCDWYLPEFNLFVEYFGMASNKKYAIKMNKKIEMCKKYKINLLEIYDKDIRNLNKILQNFYNIPNDCQI